ncbi:MAG TPA: HAD family hydrolase [Candidatus Acidoferrales bacterium]|nr:HAD family hydrolase [Candidatus Acidoferrales bacterium]
MRTEKLNRTKTQITCRGLLFDMDGVLLDSTPAVARVWHHWAVEHGFNPEEVVRAAHGRPSISTIRDYLPSSDHHAENHEVERRELGDLEGIVPWAGAVELLQSLPIDQWAIVTSCTRPLAEARLLAGGLPRPKFFISSDDIEHGKPAPDPYLKGAQMLKLNPADCLVVEDVPAGVRSGKAAGCRVIALCTTMPHADLRYAGADWLVENCSAISVIASQDTKDEIRLAVEEI